MADGLAGVVNEGVLFEAEGDGEGVCLGAGEVDPDGSNRDWLLGLGQTELDHEPGLEGLYRTMEGLDSSSETWYWYFLVHFSTMLSTSRYPTDASDIVQLNYL